MFFMVTAGNAAGGPEEAAAVAVGSAVADAETLPLGLLFAAADPEAVAALVEAGPSPRLNVGTLAEPLGAEAPV